MNFRSSVFDGLSPTGKDFVATAEKRLTAVPAGFLMIRFRKVDFFYVEFSFVRVKQIELNTII